MLVGEEHQQGQEIAGDHKRDQVQRDFLKFTSQQILKTLRNENSPRLYELLVQAKDRKYSLDRLRLLA